METATKPFNLSKEYFVYKISALKVKQSWKYAQCKVKILPTGLYQLIVDDEDYLFLTPEACAKRMASIVE